MLLRGATGQSGSNLESFTGSGFDFSNSEVNEALVRQLDGCEFMEKAENVVLVWDTQEKLRDAQIAESDAER